MSDSQATSATPPKSTRQDDRKDALKRRARKTDAVEARSVEARSVETPSAEKIATPAEARKKPGVPKGTKRGALNKDGTPRRKPGPKPKSKARTKTAAPARTKPTAKPEKAPVKAKTKAKAKAGKTEARPPRTIAELAAQLERVDAKLSRADARRRKAIATLETAQSELESRENAARAAQRTSLVRRIDGVKAQLVSTAIDLRADTRADLKAALSAERPEVMAAVLDKVEARIDAASSDHTRAIARLNSHLADMARAVDSRLAAIESTQARETEARREALDTLTGRIDAVEQDTARAVTDIGERMVALANTLRGDIEAVRPAEGEAVGERVEALATETQNRLDTVAGQLRDETARATREAQDAREHVGELSRRHEAAMESLVARLEGLEYALSTVSAPAAVPDQAPAALTWPSEAVPAPAADPVPVAPVPVETAAPAPMPAPLPDAVPAPVPLKETAPAMDAPASDAPAHFPQEWVPPSEPAPVALQSQAAQAFAPQPLMEPVMDVSPDMVPQPDFAPMPMIDPSVVPQIGDADLPYADPGYAESPTANRPVAGDDTDGGLLARLKSGNLRKIAVPTVLAGGLALGVVHIMSGSLGEGDRAQQIADARTPASPAAMPATEPAAPPQLAELSGTAPALPSGATLDLTELPPITDTSELDVPLVPVDSEEGRSLAAAAESGNPIARYQLGLMEVERGNVDEGIAMVRSAADGGLQAAQYRLAKFYEIGEGVPKDIGMAVKLTERAAKGGHRIAMHDLGFFHANGFATGSPDPAGAVQWFETASRHGVLDSQYNLAWLLDEGAALGLPRDAESAYFWYSVAALGGDTQADDQTARLRAELGDAAADIEARVAEFRVDPVDEAANGIFRDLPWMASASTQSLASIEDVKQVQTLLNRLGYETGTPDGRVGPQTQKAIIAYQRARDLPETGEPNAAVLLSLQSEAGV